MFTIMIYNIKTCCRIYSRSPKKSEHTWSYTSKFTKPIHINLFTLRLNTLQAAPGIPFLADQRPPSPPRLNTTCAMTSVATFIKGCRRSVQNLQNLSHVLQCHLMLLSDASCFVSNSQTCFWRKCRSQNGANSGTMAYGQKIQECRPWQNFAWAMSHQRKTRLLGGWYLLDCTIHPFVSLNDVTLVKKELPESTFTNGYFHGILTLRGMSGTFKNAVVCQGLRNFFHHQLPQLRLLGCLKSRFFSLTVQCYGGHGAQPWDAFFVSKNWWLKLFNPVDENVWNLHHGGTVGFEAPVGWNSSYFVVPT